MAQADTIDTTKPRPAEAAVAHRPGPQDYEDNLIRNLIESVCAVAGVDLVINQRLTPRTDLN